MDGMTDSAGTILRGSGNCPEYSEIFPTGRFDLVGHSTLGQTQMEVDQVRPRWFGQDLSEVPDSGIGHTQDNRTSRNDVGWWRLVDQSTYQPTDSQPIGRKRRAGDRLETRSVIDRGVRREGARQGTPRKRAKWGGLQMTSIQWWPGRPYEDARSLEVELVDAVALLQKDMAEFRTEFGYGSARKPASSSQTTRRSGFTSTSVPRYTGRSSWDQYRQVLEAIVCSNRWDGVMAALQLLSHLDGDAFNVALLVPESKRVLQAFWWGHCRSIMALRGDSRRINVSLRWLPGVRVMN